jgi:SNF2 family DNA or RNA helicase
MAFWGFEFDPASKTYRAHSNEGHLLERVTRYFAKFRIAFELSDVAQEAHAAHVATEGAVCRALEAGARFKNADAAPPEHHGFRQFLESLPRQLKDHQIKSAIHMLAVENAANFSVPGSGKTTVVLSAFGWLRHLGHVTSLFVVGPPSCFAPWQMEFEAVLGRKPSVEVLAGGDIAERQRKYYASPDRICDLYLTSFQTLQRDVDRVKHLISQTGVKFLVAIDEAHYVKQSQGAWAEAVLSIAPHAHRRCVLTGTPFPHSYKDAFNYFDILWPAHSPLSRNDRVRITQEIQKENDEEAAAALTSRIGPLFYRVRKSDLGLAPQDFRPPTLIAMNPHEQRLYDAVVTKIRNVAIGDDYQEFELLTRLRRGRMMRLRQCLSYAKLLGTAVFDYNEDLIGNDLSLRDTIKHYDELERPAKLETTVRLVAQIREQGEKVVVWSNFIETLKLLRETLTKAGHRTELIFGGTPTEAESEGAELSREAIIRGFVNMPGSVDVLIANPAACAESISLHKSCSHAVYYDLSYNCAQYLQSLDRIHRVGGSETKVSHYHFLQYADTFDQDILSNLLRKAGNMMAIIDQECPVYSLDMFSEEDELSAYDRLFRQHH